VRGEPGPEDQTVALAHLDQTWGQRVQTRSPNVQLAEGGLRYVQFRSPNGKLREELFDAKSDAHETTNRIADDPAAAKRMRERVDHYLASASHWKGGAPPLQLEEMQLNQLRALGYALPGAETQNVIERSTPTLRGSPGKLSTTFVKPDASNAKFL